MGFTDETWLEGSGRFRCRLLAEAASGYARRALREQITSSEQPPSDYLGNAKLDTMKNHTSERNIFVGNLRAAAGRGTTSVRIVGGRGVAFHVVAAGTCCCAATSASCSAFGAATQHAEVAGDNFKTGALLAFFVLPFAGLDAAFDKDQRALLKILLSNFSLFAPHDDLVPLGPLLALAVFVFVRLIRGHRKISDRLAAAGVAGFWIAAQTADENDFIHRHKEFPLRRRR